MIRDDHETPFARAKAHAKGDLARECSPAPLIVLLLI